MRPKCDDSIILLAPHLDGLVRILGGEGATGDWVRASEVKADEAACWGEVLVAGHLWVELGLDVILDDGGGKKSPDGASLGERAFVLVANRWCSPGSEHHLASWLEADFVCDRSGRRWLPPWEEHGRVQVNLSWLQGWSRTLDKLLKRKEAVEQALYIKLGDLFSLKAELVFYDLTSTYFEGEGPQELGRHGYSMVTSDNLAMWRERKLGTIHVVHIQAGPKSKQGVTGGSRGREVIKAVGITETTLPHAPETT